MNCDKCGENVGEMIRYFTVNLERVGDFKLHKSWGLCNSCYAKTTKKLNEFRDWLLEDGEDG